MQTTRTTHMLSSSDLVKSLTKLVDAARGVVEASEETSAEKVNDKNNVGDQLKSLFPSIRGSAGGSSSCNEV